MPTFTSELYDAFMEQLSENEKHMAEMAANAATCEMFGLEEDEAYDMLARFN